MRKILVSAGCSFAFGANLNDHHQRYSRIIADQFDMELLDVALPGISNQHIVSAACYGIREALKRTTADNIIVIVGWTDQSRMLYFDSRQKTIKTCYTSIKHHILSEKQEALATYVRDNLWCEQAGYYSLIHAFSHVDNFCRAEGIPVIHLPNLDLYRVMFIKKSLDRIGLQARVSLLTTDLINILTPSQEERFKQLFTQESFWGMVRKNKFEWTTGPSDRHPNEKAHQKWAERIVKDYGNILGTELRAS